MGHKAGIHGSVLLKMRVVLASTTLESPLGGPSKAAT